MRPGAGRFLMRSAKSRASNWRRTQAQNFSTGLKSGDFGGIFQSSIRHHACMQQTTDQNHSISRIHLGAPRGHNIRRAPDCRAAAGAPPLSGTVRPWTMTVIPSPWVLSRHQHVSSTLIHFCFVFLSFCCVANVLLRHSDISLRLMISL